MVRERVPDGWQSVGGAGVSGTVSQRLSREELEKKCEPIFARLMEQLGDRYNNWLVVVEPDTEEYFLGQDDYETLARARKKHPKAVFFTYRLGASSAVDYLC